MSPGVIDKAAASSFSSGALGAAAADTEALGGEELDAAALGAGLCSGDGVGATAVRRLSPRAREARNQLEALAHLAAQSTAMVLGAAGGWVGPIEAEYGDAQCPNVGCHDCGHNRGTFAKPL